MSEKSRTRGRRGNVRHCVVLKLLLLIFLSYLIRLQICKVDALSLHYHLQKKQVSNTSIIFDLCSNLRSEGKRQH